MTQSGLIPAASLQNKSSHSCSFLSTSGIPAITDVRAVARNQFKFDNIYFVRQPGVGPVKIGISNDVGRRVDSLRRSSPVPLEVLFSCRASRKVEGTLHLRFADIRLHGEWFEFTPGIEVAIRELRDIFRFCLTASDGGEISDLTAVPDGELRRLRDWHIQEYNAHAPLKSPVMSKDEFATHRFFAESYAKALFAATGEASWLVFAPIFYNKKKHGVAIDGCEVAIGPSAALLLAV